MAWQIDPTHSHVQFTVRHMMISKVRGSFEKFSGAVDFDEDEPTNSSVDVTIDVDSVNTREEQRDGHLKSPDFFDAATYPSITFKSTSAEKTGENQGKLHGNLTIKDVTHPVTLNVEYAGQAKSPWGTTSAGFTASGKISRKDWGLTWNQALETGGVLVGDDVQFDIEIELVKQ
ncbi:MAG: YceI family protein [Caldilineaceae bacterium]